MKFHVECMTQGFSARRSVVSGAAKMHPGKTTVAEIVPQQTTAECAINQRPNKARAHLRSEVPRINAPLAVQRRQIGGASLSQLSISISSRRKHACLASDLANGPGKWTWRMDLANYLASFAISWVRRETFRLALFL
jgi:hypothetical protein